MNIAVAFIMSPIIIRALGNRDYGLWELVMSVIGYMGILDLGIGPALVRFVSIADGKQDRNDLQQTISTALAFFAAVGTISVLLFTFLGYSPNIIAGKETKDIASLGTVFMLLGVNAGMLFPLQVFIATLMGVQRHYFINTVRVVVVIMRSALTYYLLLHYPGRGLITLALLEPIFTVIQLLLFAGAVHFDKEIPGFALLAVTKTKMKELFSFGAKSATILIASRLQNQSVPLIIGNVIGLGYIVYFVMPNRLVDYARGFSLALGFPLAPYFGSQIAKGDFETLKKNWINSALALQIITTAMPILLLFLGNSFLTSWISGDIAAAGYGTLISLIIGLAFQALSPNAFGLISASDSHGRAAVVWLVTSIVSVIAGIVGGIYFGLTGVAVATTLPTIIGSLYNLVCACGKLNITLRDYFMNTTYKLMIPLFMLTFSLYIMNALYESSGLLIIFIKAIASALIYIIFVYSFSIETHIKNALKDKLLGSATMYKGKVL